MSHPFRLRRSGVAVLVAMTLTLFMAACGTSENTKPAPTTGAVPHTSLMAQWKYKSIVTPKKKQVQLKSANAWLTLSSGGHAQGQDGLPWRGTYRTGKGWITLKATQRASLPLAKGASHADRLASSVTSKLLKGERVTLSRPDKNHLRLSVDGYVLTLKVWH